MNKSTEANVLKLEAFCSRFKSANERGEITADHTALTQLVLLAGWASEWIRGAHEHADDLEAANYDLRKKELNSTAWLIESKGKNDTPIYWEGGQMFSENADDAVRFCRKQDAEKMIEVCEVTDSFAVEHVFLCSNEEVFGDGD